MYPLRSFRLFAVDSAIVFEVNWEQKTVPELNLCDLHVKRICIYNLTISFTNTLHVMSKILLLEDIPVFASAFVHNMNSCEW